MTPVTTLRTALRAEDCELLERALAAEDVVASARLLDLPLAEVSADDMDDLREAVELMLVRQGFDADRSANELGSRCEHLIDRLAPWHWGKGD